MQAVFLLRNKETEKSQSIVSKVLAEQPNHIETTALLAQILVSQGKTDAALNNVQAAIVARPKEKSLRFLKIALHRKLVQLPEAEQEYKNLIDLDPADNKLKYALAEFYVSSSQLDKAEQLLQQIITSDPENLEAKLALIKFLARFKSLEDADKTLEGYVKAAPKQYKLRFVLAELRQNQPDRARKIYQEIVDLDGTGNDGLEARVRLAQIAMQLTEKDRARQLVDEVLAEDDENKQALLIRSSLYLDENKAEQAIADLRIILGNDPQFEPALRLLAVAYLLNGDPVLAREALEKAVESNPKSIKSRTMLAGLLVKNNDIDAASQLLEDGLKLKPNDATSLALISNIYIKKKQWDRARKSANALLAVSKEPYKAHFLLGTIYQNQGSYDQAIGEYQQVLTEKPDNVVVLRRLIETYIARKQPERALDYLNKRISSNPDDANSVELIGEIRAWQNKLANAERSYQMAIKIDPKLVITYRQLARLYMQQKQPDKAISIYQQGLTVLPGQSDLLMELASLYQNSGEIDQAIATYKLALDHEPNSLYAANNYAALVADARNDRESLNNAMKVAERFKSTDQPAFLDTYGWLAYRLAQYNEAVPALEKAVQLAPDFPVFRYHLGMVYHAVDRDAAALRELAQAVESKGADFAGIKEARQLIEELKNKSG